MWWWLLACSGGSATGPTDGPIGGGPDSGPDPIETGAGTPTGDTATPPDPCAAPSIELGTGATAHVPLVPDGLVILAHGPQGGWHVDVSGVVTGTGQTAALTPSLTRLSDGASVAGDQPPTYLALIPRAPCGHEFYGLRAYVDDLPGTDQALICALAGEPLELGLVIEDLASGDVQTASIRVVAALDPQDVSRCP